MPHSKGMAALVTLANLLVTKDILRFIKTSNCSKKFAFYTKYLKQSSKCFLEGNEILNFNTFKGYLIVAGFGTLGNLGRKLGKIINYASPA